MILSDSFQKFLTYNSSLYLISAFPKFNRYFFITMFYLAFYCCFFFLYCLWISISFINGNSGCLNFFIGKYFLDQMTIAISHWPAINDNKISKVVEYIVINIIQVRYTPYTRQFFISCSFTNKEWGIMGPLSRPRSKILRVAVSRIILSSEASKVKLVGNLVA